MLKQPVSLNSKHLQKTVAEKNWTKFGTDRQTEVRANTQTCT